MSAEPTPTQAAPLENPVGDRVRFELWGHTVEGTILEELFDPVYSRGAISYRVDVDGSDHVHRVDARCLEFI